MMPQHHLPADIERTSMKIITGELAQRVIAVGGHLLVAPFTGDVANVVVDIPQFVPALRDRFDERRGAVRPIAALHVGVSRGVGLPVHRKRSGA